MANTIGNFGNLASPISRLGLQKPNIGGNAGATQGPGFQKMLTDALRSTANLQNDAQHSVQDKIAGADLTNVEVLTDMRKADLAMRMLLQIRNKLLEGFNEIKQMQF